MQTREKRLLIIIAILLIIFALSFMYMKKSKVTENVETEDSKHIKVEAINKEYDVNGLKITNIDLYQDKDESKFAALVTNNTENDLKISSLTVNFYDNENSVILEGDLLYNVTLAKGNSQYVNLNGIIDLKKVSNIDFNVVYE